jgi:c-di-GMP-binding flagellar brake protein YcgR
MPPSFTDTIRRIPDSQPAEINLPLTSGNSVQLKCIYKESIAPCFFMVFPPKQLPAAIDTSKNCMIAIKGEEHALTFTAKIEAIKGDRIIELMAQKSIDPTSLRTCFRADLRTTITASYEPGPEERAKIWSFSGETLDLSEGGTLAIFPSEFLNKQRIQIHIKLPHLNKDMHLHAHVVRTQRLRKERWQIALQFDNITQKDRDLIASCCLMEQRKQLRERIQTT